MIRWIQARRARAGTEALRYLEDVVVKAGGAALRYGSFYGPGAIDAGRARRKRQFRSSGAAPATCRGSSRRRGERHRPGRGAKATGVFNIVDDEPAPASEWLPYLAACAGAKQPMRMPKWLARLLAGDMAVMMMTEARGFSNAKAKRPRLGAAPPLVAPGLPGESMTRTQEFERLWLLLSDRLRILGSVSEAEDAVQETWLRYETSPTEPRSTKFLRPW